MLAHNIVKHPAELQADFQRVYNMHDVIGGVETGRIPVRYAADLCAQLPLDARIHVVENPDYGWSKEAQLAAHACFLIQCLMYGLGGGKGKKPKPIFPTQKGKRASGNELPTEAVELDELIELISAGIAGNFTEIPKPE